MTPTTKAGRAHADFLVRMDGWGRAAADTETAAIEREAAAAERERLLHYIQHEPDCALRTPEGDCVCGLAAILAEPSEPPPLMDYDGKRTGTT